MARLLERYQNEIRPALQEELGIGNPMAIPKLSKVVVSMGTGSPTVDRHRYGAAVADMARITGPKPRMRRAYKRVSHFKPR